MFVEELLKFLVSEVNVELFKSVNREIFKTKYVENTDRGERSFGSFNS